MPRVVGTDPGTGSLDMLLLEDGRVVDQASLAPQADPDAFLATLRGWAPIDLIAGPSGYGLPLVRADAATAEQIDLMAFVRDDERGAAVGVLGFRRWVRDLVASGLPAVFLPGGVHLPTIPPHRKRNAIDLGTPDKLAVAALALRQDRALRGQPLSQSTFALVEIGSAFTAVLAIERGKLVDAAAGSRGPIGLRSGGAWDGEVAYWLSPLSKDDLFRGGLADLGEPGPLAFRESLRKAVAGLRSVTAFDRVYLSGAGLERADILAWTREALDGLGELLLLPSLPGARVKHAAQGAALLADGLAAGSHADLVDSLELRQASGTITDGLRIRPPA